MVLAIEHRELLVTLGTIINQFGVDPLFSCPQSKHFSISSAVTQHAEDAPLFSLVWLRLFYDVQRRNNDPIFSDLSSPIFILKCIQKMTCF